MAVKVATKYEDDDLTVHRIVLSSAYSAVAGTAPTGAVTAKGTVKVTKSSREYGVRPRGVRLSRVIGTAPDQFKKYTFLPVLTVTGFAGSGFSPGSTITIGSTAWTVAKKIGEDAD
jgi:hypothetical protein